MAQLPVPWAGVSPISVPSQGASEGADKQSCVLPCGAWPQSGITHRCTQPLRQPFP